MTAEDAQPEDTVGHQVPWDDYGPLYPDDYHYPLDRREAA